MFRRCSLHLQEGAPAKVAILDQVLSSFATVLLSLIITSEMLFLPLLLSYPQVVVFGSPRCQDSSAFATLIGQQSHGSLLLLANTKSSIPFPCTHPPSLDISLFLSLASSILSSHGTVSSMMIRFLVLLDHITMSDRNLVTVISNANKQALCLGGHLKVRVPGATMIHRTMYVKIPTVSAISKIDHTVHTAVLCFKWSPPE